MLIDKTHIQKSSLRSPPIFRSAKGSWRQNVESGYPTGKETAKEAILLYKSFIQAH